MRNFVLIGLPATAVAGAAVMAMTGTPAISRGGQGERLVVANLETLCTPARIGEALGGMTPKVAVQEISDGPKLPGGAKFTAATAQTPAYCQVTGSFVTNDETGKTANFLATLPADWNGKYLQLGCANNCGEIRFINNPAEPGVTLTSQGYPFEAIVKGYAIFSTDEGHAGTSWGSWALKPSGQIDDDAIEDFYVRASRTLAVMGKRFTVQFYQLASGTAQTIARAYFSGCSGGGRDAFVAASTYPEEFDGIIAGSPYANPMAAAYQAGGVAFAQIRSDAADLPVSLVNQIDPIVKAKCDALDGVRDGLIQNPAACNFRPERDLPRCDGKRARTQCFSSAQIETISTLMTAVTDEDGKVVQTGFGVGDLHAAFRLPSRPQDLAARDPWPTDARQDGLFGVANGNLRILAHRGDPDFALRSLFAFRAGGAGAVTGYRVVVPKADVAMAMAAARPGIGDVPENADRLISLDRKFLIWQNLGDTVLSPFGSINYYKRLAARHGGYAKLQGNVRLFALPGTDHCSKAGPGPNNFDALDAMEHWVEKGEAPDAIVASLYDPDNFQWRAGTPPLRTMPLCKFPTMARYHGRGDINDAANWSCPAGDRRMLKVGESGRQAGVVE
ncbi:tannase/feruloyl esterase family alpha/beta hydrolase [Sphingomonas sp.]|uniref:tannase/feruloyl esterase family alpha/beta hydrolase n=1 Tax=Sphingomonas sp. TaxID=28214 RepID=UPI001B2B6C13|nr:tannase/feruloyl esterase family alpha/beta hydrolase [Sphingomonas sp.]MBO9714548.1 tannase/feruloyl esterase family alpha/beta hydrolase [Sphingomonas sp.]